MELLSLIFGNGLVWMAGIALLLAVPLRGSAALEGGLLPWTLGCGWLAGAFALTLWMRALSAVQIPFGILSVGAPFLLIAVGGAVLLRPRARAVGMLSPRINAAALLGAQLQGWQRALWLAILAWLVLRYALLLGEVLVRPLYPWDAWTQWGTKARVWFELKTMAPFVPLAEWLQPGNTGYIDAAPHYPALVPLLQVWSALLIGAWNDVLVNFSWWLTALAFAFAIFGFLARRGLQPLWALVVTWFVASLPIFNVHVALAGYADLPMAAFLTLGVLAGLQWVSTRQWRDAALAVVLLAACVTIKNPGKAWLVVLLPGFVAALLPKGGVKVAGVMLALAIGAVLVLAQTKASVLGYQLRLNFVSPWRGLSDAWFAFGNWHLLWYGAIAVAVLGWRQLFSRELAPLTIVIGSGLLFLFFGFAFTNAAQWVADQSTVNRATLHLALLVAVWMALVFQRWYEAQVAKAPTASAPTMPETIAAA